MTNPDRLTALLVDDELELLESLRRVLRRRGMDVLTAGNGERALELIRSRPVDVVVLDLKMPGRDGLAVLDELRREFPACRVIVLTGHPQAGGRAEILDRGAHECLMKPPDIERLVDIIRRAHLDKPDAAGRDRAGVSRGETTSDDHPSQPPSNKRRTS